MMMEHGRFEFSNIFSRPTWKWPNGARVAMWIAPNIEHYHYDVRHSDSNAGVVPPDVRAYSMKDYGNRVGVWRIMKVLEHWGIRATVCLNAEVCTFEPEIIEAGNRLQWEWMGHNISNSLPFNGLPEDREREVIAETVRIIREGTGKAPTGWLGSGLAENYKTLDFLREAGIEYVCDWVNDDQPYVMKTEHGPLYSIPYSIELNDTRIYPDFPPSEYVRRMKDAFDVLYEEGAESARVMGMPLHPYKSGVHHRIKALDESIAYINRHDKVWWATGSEIVAAYREATGA
jgi:peptidoglycan/xylan/chitin deacetylase (PgdA/CDA1 family)